MSLLRCLRFDPSWHLRWRPDICGILRVILLQQLWCGMWDEAFLGWGDVGCICPCVYIYIYAWGSKFICFRTSLLLQPFGFQSTCPLSPSSSPVLRPSCCASLATGNSVHLGCQAAFSRNRTLTMPCTTLNEQDGAETFWLPTTSMARQWNIGIREPTSYSIQHPT